MPLHRHCATGYASWAFEPPASGRPWLIAGYQLAQQLSLFRALFIRIFIYFSSAYIVLKGYTIKNNSLVSQALALAPFTRLHLSASCCYCSDIATSSTPPHGSTYWPAATPPCGRRPWRHCRRVPSEAPRPSQSFQIDPHLDAAGIAIPEEPARYGACHDDRITIRSTVVQHRG